MNDVFLQIPKAWRFVDTDHTKSAVIYEAVDGEHTDRILITHRRRAVMGPSTARQIMQADMDKQRGRFVDPSVQLARFAVRDAGVAGFAWTAEDRTHVPGEPNSWPLVFRCLFTNGRATLEITVLHYDRRGSTMRQAFDMLWEWH